MSTSITALFDEMIARVRSVLPSAVEIPDGLNIAGQSALFLKDGFAVLIGPGQNTNRQLGCKITTSRTMTIVLTRQITTTASNAEASKVIMKRIMEDQMSLIAEFETETTMGHIVMKALYENDGGLELLVTQDQSGRFYILSSNFSVEYEDTYPTPTP